ncbi:hypothetical protein H012_gp184 [Acanthamoeba polyphaga moumouvirus]|uniref:Uncharacterized protein n=1 Tax=Acanthamoeba polyphaga moumouvirus TaxID=1269028 RepID=L7RD38_9VIRU|nr:hypothetical protein H012_gp184 [Acanthamoeba polyphaga moumouvirus]AGC02267.1 hypothetical protein Moumou_00748 [Acanthamoeba polyphaga moumouvirus]
MNCELRIFIDAKDRIKFLGSNRFNSEIFGWKCLKDILSIQIKRFLDYFEEIVYDMLSYNMEFLQKNNIDYTKLPRHVFFDLESINTDNDLFVINLLFANKYTINIINSLVCGEEYKYKLSLLSEYASDLDLYLLVINDLLKNYDVDINNKYIEFVLYKKSTYSPNVNLSFKDITILSDDLKEYLENYLIMNTKITGSEFIILIKKSAWNNKLVSISDFLKIN